MRGWDPFLKSGKSGVKLGGRAGREGFGGLEDWRGGCGMFFYCYLHKGLCINVLIFSTIFGLCSLDSNGKGFRCVLLL